eukprot:scaffold173178_cov26-Tisochrysis_lutea.AAC.2
MAGLGVGALWARGRWLGAPPGACGTAGGRRRVDQLQASPPVAHGIVRAAGKACRDGAPLCAQL